MNSYEEVISIEITVSTCIRLSGNYFLFVTVLNYGYLNFLESGNASTKRKVMTAKRMFKVNAGSR